MKVSNYIECVDFPCADVNHDRHLIPGIEIEPNKVSMVMISEAAPADAADYYYAQGNPLFEQTTVQAFNDAGADVSSIREILERDCVKTRFMWHNGASRNGDEPVEEAEWALCKESTAISW